MTPKKILLAALFAAFAFSQTAIAQDAETEKGAREISSDAEGGPVGQPRRPRCGPRRDAVGHEARAEHVSLEQCDLGKGPGKLDGAFAELPRYFADADKVMDLETRLLWCMEKLQGFNRADLVRRPHPAAPAGEGAWRDGDLRRQQVVGNEVRGEARPGERERSGGRWAARSSCGGRGRSISRVRRVTPSRASASRLQGLPFLSSRMKRRR